MPETRPQTRRQKVEKKEQAIIAAARVIFQKNGFEKAKIADIAKSSGVAEGTVYTYFENKNALLFAVAVEFYDRLTRDAALGIKDISITYERLQFLARHHLERVSKEWQMLALAMLPDKVSNEYRKTEGYQLNRTYVEVFDTVIREGINRGEIRSDIPLSVVRDIFYGGLEYGARTMRIHASTTDIDQTITHFMEVLKGGIFQQINQQKPQDESLEKMMSRLESATAKLEAIAR
ncbi:MAG: TetR/AcrR family transcriptional regulator [Proteobacteria bacterium]|nr:TetR/AcrR family transcriptional regulator [Pseudomonadota bacterium]